MFVSLKIVEARSDGGEFVIHSAPQDNFFAARSLAVRLSREYDGQWFVGKETDDELTIYEYVCFVAGRGIKATVELKPAHEFDLSNWLEDMMCEAKQIIGGAKGA